MSVAYLGVWSLNFGEGPNLSEAASFMREGLSEANDQSQRPIQPAPYEFTT